MKAKILFWVFFLYLATVAAAAAGQSYTAHKVRTIPLVDGHAGDPAWQKAQMLVTHDQAASIDITLKAVYSDTHIYLLVSFPDDDASLTHKSWVWNQGRKMYNVGNDREDTFIIKWNMMSEPLDLSLYADNPLRADVWFWKANRTNPAGFADDKIHIHSSTKNRDTTELISRTGKSMFLDRRADKGGSAYKIDLVTTYGGDILPRYTSHPPSDSRADVRAKGVWQAGRWTIEFARLLQTGNQDDLQFEVPGSYQFGVSRYEIAGREINPKLTQPLYGCGDISETITITLDDREVLKP